ncbi:MAG: SCP2 sterol-binding domain-containing protein, partial [Planctomycetes bacterium]|nr:SCP2 sterol-binding domain-containing protein [Planctomycetota bacterium]
MFAGKVVPCKWLIAEQPTAKRPTAEQPSCGADIDRMKGERIQMLNKTCQVSETVTADTEKRPDITAHTTHVEYFEEMMYSRVNNSPIPKIRSLNAIIQFDIVGKDPGKWTVIIEEGIMKRIDGGVMERYSAEDASAKANVCDETASGDRLRKTKCIFRLDGNTFMSIVRREIKPQQALFQRKV